MPKSEIKNTFTGGRMNKDLDERLITTGEYRDAMNVQVTTSDGSDVGSLHNIMGNYQIDSIANSTVATCIGSVIDEKNNKLYWMIEGLTNNIQLPSGQWPNEYYKADAIAEYDHDTGSVNPVVVDVYEYKNAFQGTFTAGNIFTVNSQSELWDASAGVMRKRVYPGMILTIADSNSNPYPSLTVESVDYTSNRAITFASSLSATQVTTVNLLGGSLTFTSPQRALNFAINPNTGKHYLITGINIIDKQLFWTDDNSEPKRIHIERYRDTGTFNFTEHSHTPTRDFTQTQLIYTNTYPLSEEHITVIRQKPIVAPQLLLDNSTGGGITEGEIINNVDSNNDPINSIEAYEEGDVSWIDFVAPIPNFQLGDNLTLTSTDANNITKEMRVRVGDPNDPTAGIWYNALATSCAQATWGGTVGGCTAFMVEILSADPGITLADDDWHAELEQDPPLFEFKFPRFATRYKYEDGEYSAFGPFSEVAFLPDRPGGKDFDFVAYKGYNIGMRNQIRKLALKDFIPEKDLLPDDIIEIDILYKESNSPNVYSILTIKPDEQAWQTRVTYTGNRVNTTQYPYNFSGVKGYLPIESEMIHGILSENQLLRSWDNVPRKAKAQEVSGNRLIYGNYLQNYSLLDAGDNIITPSLTIGTRHYDVSKDDEDLSPEQVYPTDSYKYSPSKSIKSLRTYQLGITYIDKYGRETPVLTDNNEKRVSTYLNEWYSDKQVKITGQVNSVPPEWAKYQKFFIKETSSEYYNLALDRWYDAEDDNIWLSFPSSERNKVDINTYLILKKEHDNNNPILEEARYDILAIENEAPDFIKTRKLPIGTANDDGSNNDTFGDSAGTGFPIENQSFVRVNSNRFDGNMLLNTIGQKRDNLFIRFELDGFFTNWYEVTHVFDDTTASGTWLLNLVQEFGDDINILTNDPTTPYNSKKAPISMYVMQEEIDNAPEFDGRFFVKIYNNSLIRERIIKKDPNSTRYSIPTSYKVHYINANPDDSTIDSFRHTGWDAWDTSSYSAWYGSGYSGHIPQICAGDIYTTMSGLSHNTGKHFWGKFSNKNESQFFIDRVPYFQVKSPPDTVPSGSHQGNSAGGGTEASYGAAPGWSAYSWSGTPSSGHWPYAVDSPSQGIDNSYWLHLSLNGGNDSHLNEDHHVAEIDFVNKLTTAGTLWRWAEDPDETIYITKGGSGKRVGTMFNIAEETWWHGSHTYKSLELHSHDETKYNRNRWTINAEALLTGSGFGSGPSGYHPGNPTELDAHFANDGTLLTSSTQVISGVTYPVKPSTPAPGIRQDGMGIGVQTSSGYTVPTINKKVCDIDTTTNTGIFTNTENFIPGSVTWQIVEPTQLTELKHSSHNPAIFETEPKENLDLEIYHEVGQTYPLEYNRKTNELYTPVGSVVECWRPDSTLWVLTNPTWNPMLGGYPGTDPIPVGNINIGGNPTAVSPVGWVNWVGPIIVSQVGDDTVTLVDDSGAAFNSNTNWPEVHIVPGDHLKFIRPDGSATSAIVTGASGDVYTLDADISDRVMTLPWFNSYSFGNGVESNRIRDDYNQVTIDKGPKVSSILDEPYKEERKLNGLIYSGIYNSTSGVNNLNQFIQAEKITKDLNPTFGSIQKLFQRRINLIAFCEDKVVKILSNRDALYNADGSVNLTATDRVLGDAQPYVGNYGISKNPESFASENYRAYFTDKQRSAVLRLSKDGLTPISDHGMIDWFRDNLSLSDRLIGGFDVEKREYNLTLPDILKTLSFKEDVRGWVSFKSFIPENSISLAGKYCTFNNGNIWRHHSANDPSNNIINFNTFYNTHTPSHVTTVFNTDPKSVKNFQTLNYEGTQSRVDQLVEYTNPNDQILYTDPDYHNLEPNKLGWYVENIHTDMQDGTLKEFIQKEGKWFNYIRGKEIPVSSSGLIGAGFKYDPNEFSWQGIGMSNTITSWNNIGGCTDPNAVNYGCATMLHPNSPTPCIGSSPDINGVCADGSTCSPLPTPGCCGAGNGYDPIEFDDGTCNLTGIIYGCLSDPNAFNYNCETALYSTPPTSPCNDGVTHDDGSCIGTPGCTDSTMFNYDPLALADCNSDPLVFGQSIQNPGWNASPCCEPIVYGCMEQGSSGQQTQFNFTSLANTACQGPQPTTPGSGCFPPNCFGPFVSTPGCCEPIIYGCTDTSMWNYYAGANVNQISASNTSDPCIPFINGCTDNTVGTNPDVNDNCPGSNPPTTSLMCSTIGCCGAGNGYYASNYDPSVNTDDGSCTGPVGCMDSIADNYDPTAYIDDGSCTYGCCNSTFVVGPAQFPLIPSLTFSLGPGSSCPGYGTATLLSIAAVVTITRPDGSFYVDGNGVTWNTNNVTIPLSSNAVNRFIDFAALQSGVWRMDVQYVFITTGTGGAIPSCTNRHEVLINVGCMDPLASNYDPAAVVEDGSCTYPNYGCTDGGPGQGLGNPFVYPLYGEADNFDISAIIDNGSCIYTGCMDSYATNFNVTATYTNQCAGCCSYGTSGCMNNSIGCHPAIVPIADGVSIPGLGTCSSSPASVAPSAVWNATNGNCGTCRDGTSCGGTGCCGASNGFGPDNFDPSVSVACASCCNIPSNTGCGVSTFALIAPHPVNPIPITANATNYDPCVTVNDVTLCLPEVLGCVDPTAINHGAYQLGSDFGPHQNHTNFGNTVAQGWIPVNPLPWNQYSATNSPKGQRGANTDDGVTCIQPVYGCMDDGTSATDPNGNPWQGRPTTWTGPAGNYSGSVGATVNQVSSNNTNSPCCYNSGCILPNYYTVTPTVNWQDATVNLSTQGCLDFIGGTGGSVQDCYGGMINTLTQYPSGITGTASGTTSGNGVEVGNTLNVALNGGETCATCDPTSLPLGYYVNTNGYLDPGDFANTGPLQGSTPLPTAWSAGAFGPPDLSCCTYTDGCMDPCALNFNPNATLQSGTICTTGSPGWTVSNPPPWQNIPGQGCSTAVAPVV